MTLQLARVALGNQERTFGVSFVALSRVRRLTDLLIDYRDFTLERLQMIRLPEIAVAYQTLTNRLNAITTTNYEE